MKYTISYHNQSGTYYLSGLESHCFGERYLGYFDARRSSAFPLEYDQACKLCKMLQSDLRLIHLRVVSYPFPSPEEVQQ